MSHTIRWYNKPNNTFYWHPWQQIPPEPSFDGSRKGFKRYARKVKRLNDKLIIKLEILNLKDVPEYPNCYEKCNDTWCWALSVPYKLGFCKQAEEVILRVR